MVYIEVNKNNFDEELITEINKNLRNNNANIFLLIFMEGCGPCNSTRPEWYKLRNILSNNILNDENILILSIDKDYFNKLKNLGNEPNSFPTIRYIKNSANINENYEDSSIENKDRSIDSFILWIKNKLNREKITKNEMDEIQNQYGGKKIKKRTVKNKKKNNSNNKQNKHLKYGGKWSLKYKRSINCKKPHGFSQKQYCKYGRK